MAGQRVLVRDEKAQRAVRGRFAFRSREATSASLLMALGAAFAVVGLVDLALLWRPLALGNPVWEFGTVSGTFDNVPIGALGLTLLVLGLLRHPQRSATWLRAAAALFGLVTLALIALGGIYALATPAVIRQAAPPTLVALRGTILKNIVELVAYVLAFGVMTVIAWRGAVRRSR